MARNAMTVLLILLMGCSSMKAMSRGKALEPATSAYARAIQWGDYKLAKAFTGKQETTDQEPSFETFNRIKVTSYEILTRDVSEDNFQATQAVEIKYFYKDQLKEKSIIDRQLWEFDEAADAWRLKTGLPRFE